MDLNLNICIKSDGKYSVDTKPDTQARHHSERWEVLNALRVLGFGEGYVARDRDGVLYAYDTKPKRHGAFWGVENTEIHPIPLPVKLFPDVQWEDAEPLSIRGALMKEEQP